MTKYMHSDEEGRYSNRRRRRAINPFAERLECIDVGLLGGGCGRFVSVAAASLYFFLLCPM
eukprot:2492790-Pyramimonas_sp.AAC.1